jgi:hypothetical protein
MCSVCLDLGAVLREYLAIVDDAHKYGDEPADFAVVVAEGAAPACGSAGGRDHFLRCRYTKNSTLRECVLAGHPGRAGETEIDEIGNVLRAYATNAEGSKVRVPPQSLSAHEQAAAVCLHLKEGKATGLDLLQRIVSTQGETAMHPPRGDRSELAGKFGVDKVVKHLATGLFVIETMRNSGRARDDGKELMGRNGDNGKTVNKLDFCDAVDFLTDDVPGRERLVGHDCSFLVHFVRRSPGRLFIRWICTLPEIFSNQA